MSKTSILTYSTLSKILVAFSVIFFVGLVESKTYAQASTFTQTELDSMQKRIKQLNPTDTAYILTQARVALARSTLTKTLAPEIELFKAQLPTIQPFKVARQVQDFIGWAYIKIGKYQEASELLNDNIQKIKKPEILPLIYISSAYGLAFCIYYKDEKPDVFIEKLTILAPIAEKFGDYSIAARMYWYIADISSTHFSNYAKNLYYLLKASEVIKKHSPNSTKKLQLQGAIFHSISINHLSNNNLAIAHTYLDSAYTIYHKLQDADGLMSVLDVYAAIEYSRKDYTKALHYALEQKKYVLLSKQEGGVLQYYLRLGNIYEALGQYDSALVQYQAGIKKISANVVPNSRSKYANAVLQLMSGGIYFHKKNYTESRKALNAAREIFGTKNHWDYQYQIEKLYAKIDSAERNFKTAYLHQLLASVAKDSAHNEEKLKELEKVHTRNQLELKQAKDAVIAQKQKQITQQAIYDRDYLQFGIALVVSAVIITIALSIRRNPQSLGYARALALIGMLLLFEWCLELTQRWQIAHKLDAPVYMLIPNIVMALLFPLVLSWIYKYLQSSNKAGVVVNN